MEITRYRSEFNIYAIDRTPQEAKALAESLQAMGYERTLFFPTLESALLSVRNEPPHIVVLDTGPFDPAVEKFLMDLRALSPETLSILLLPRTQVLKGLEFVSRSLAYDTLVKPFASSLELLQKVDRAADRLYYQFESEQLREHFESLSNRNAVPTVAAEPAPVAVHGVISDLAGTLKKLAQTKELDEAVRLFINAFSRLSSDTPALYFKYLPNHLSLVFSQASLLPENKFRGIGIDLKKVSDLGPDRFFENPASAKILREFVGEVFKKDRFTVFTHRVDQEVVGLFLALEQFDLKARSDLSLLIEAFDLAYKRNRVLKEKHAVDIYDPLTGLANHRHFTRLLGEEVSRSRRLLMPTSVLSLSLDRYDVLLSKLGPALAETVVKYVAQILKKTSRTNDHIARIGPADFALILPHTAQVGATVKAERLRRTIEATRFPGLDQYGVNRITVSCGVSEYPGLAGDADSLMRSADEALFEVKRDGGNRVALAAVPSGFVPDFVPLAVPSSPREREGGLR